MATSRRPLGLLIALATAILISGPAAAQGDEFEALLKDGLRQVRAGNYEEGIRKLRSALSMDPTSDQVIAALGRAEYEAMLRVLAAGREAANIAREILDRAEPVYPDKKFDPEELKQLVKTAVTSSHYNQRSEAGLTLGRVYGEYAVPHLVRYLGSSNTDHKVNAQITLMHKIGREAVLPLNEALQSGDSNVRRLVAAALQKIGDIRSLAPLAEAAETDTNETSRRAASVALDTLSQKYPEAAGRGAAELYLWLARDYYNDVYRVKSFADKPLAVWRWKDGLQARPVPRHLYMIKLAGEGVYDSLRLDPSNAASRALLARVLASSWSAARAGAELSDDEMSIKARDVIASLGWETLARALSDSIESQDHQVATTLLEVMPQVYGSADFTPDSPVVRAMYDTANVVRFGAANAILQFNGHRRISAFADPAGFLNLVAESVGEVVPRQILVIDADDARRNKILAELQRSGYIAYDARSATSGIIRAARFQGLDLIVLAAQLPDMEGLGAVSRLKKDVRTKHIPVVLVASASQAADAEWISTYQGKVDKITSVPEGTGLPAEGFKRAVTGAFGNERPDAQARYSISVTTLGSLAKTDTANTLFDWSTLTATVASVLESKAPVAVRHAAVNALGNLGDPQAVETLGRVFARGDNARMRADAGHAIAAVCRRGRVQLGDDTFGTLLRGTSDSNAGVRAAAFTALGSADLTPAQSLAVARANRPGEGGGTVATTEGCGDGCGCGME
ncbi:MAG: HEAT repeat domain-containing protein [Planctomycetota bacterium]